MKQSEDCLHTAKGVFRENGARCRVLGVGKRILRQAGCTVRSLEIMNSVQKGATLDFGANLHVFGQRMWATRHGYARSKSVRQC